jgi:LEA14-like dessication related protein
MKRKILVACILASTVIMSCSSPKMIEYRDFKNFSIKQAGFVSSTVEVDLEYYNPNNYGLQLRNVDLDIMVNNKPLGHSVLDTLIQVPRKSNFIIPIKFDVDMKHLVANAFYTLLGKEVTVKATGKVRAGKSNIFLNFPVNYEGKHTFTLFK